MPAHFEYVSNLRIVGISLSLSCLYLFRVYRQLLDPAYDWYFEYRTPRLEISTALVCSLFIFCVFTAMLVLLRRHEGGRRNKLLLISFVLLACIAFGPLSTELLTWWFVQHQVWFKYVLPVAIFCVCLLLPRNGLRHLDRVTANLATTGLIIVPFSILVFAHALMRVVSPSSDLGPSAIEQDLPPRGSKGSLKRVVWIVFDEFGQKPLSQRPSHIRLPAIDDLTASSFVADNAYPPHYWTSASLPALLTGRDVHWVLPHGPDKISLHFRSDNPPVELAETDTVLDDVLSLNGRNAVAGWYHPYPRLFRNKLALGYWTPAGWFRCRSSAECVSSTVANAFEDTPVLRDVFPGNPFVSDDRLPHIRNRFLNHPREHAEYHLALTERAKGLVGNEDMDFVFLHFAVPHGPYLNRRNEVIHSYFEALEAVDETIAILRAEMERKGLWDRTTLVISGDHWLRSDLSSPDGLEPKELFLPDNTRVPFIVRLPDGQSVRYTHPFNTLVSRHLIRSIMTGETSTAEGVAEWLDRARKERPELTNFHPCREIETPYMLDRPAAAARLLTCK